MSEASPAGAGPSVRVSLIWAQTAAGVIGRDGGLPWQLPADMAYFRAVTLGKPCIMGRRTFDSLPKPLSKLVKS